MSSRQILGFSLLLVSLVLLGTWPAILRLCSSHKTHGCLQTRARDTRFAYLDYAFSYVLSSSIPILLALLRDEMDTNQTTPRVLVAIAMLGGGLLSFGNLSLQWSTTVFGAPLTTVVAVQASLTVILGTSINYFLEPEKTDHVELLLGGVLVFLIAIGLAARAHLLYCQRQQLQMMGYAGIELKGGGYTTSYDSTGIIHTDELSQHGEEISLDERPANTTVVSPNFALMVAMLGGCCFGFFSPAFNVAVNNPFGFEGGAQLSVPVANLWFSFAFMIASVFGNLGLIYRPPLAGGLIPSTISDYWHESFGERRLAILAGLTCGLANVLQFQGGKMVGFATADLVQAYPLVSTVWDVFLFGEFSRPGWTVILYIISMYTMYLTGIGLMISSAAA